MNLQFYGWLIYLFNLWPPHTSWFFLRRREILTFRFRQAYDKIGPCRAISGSARSYLKTSWRALSASVPWTKTICRGLLTWPNVIPTWRQVANKKRLVCGKLTARQVWSRWKIGVLRQKNGLVWGGHFFRKEKEISCSTPPPTQHLEALIY